MDREDRLRAAIADESVVDADEQMELVAELTRVRDDEGRDVEDDTHPPRGSTLT